MNVRKASLVLIAVAFGLLCFSFILATIIVTKEGGWVCPDRPEEPWFWNSTEHHLKTNAFKIEGSEWRITWVAFSGYITESTQAWIRVYDAYTDKLIREVTLTYKNDEAYLNCRGRFYMEIDVYGPVKEWGCICKRVCASKNIQTL